MDLHRSVASRANFLVLLALLLVAAAVPATGSTAPEEGSAVLRVHQQYYPERIDPQQSAGLEVAAFLGANYEGLTRLDKNLDVVPAAAESWEFSADGLVITFRLRDGLTYSDGSALTAERFADVVRRTCDPTIAGDYQHILFDVVGCRDFATLFQETAGATVAAADDAKAYEAARAAIAVRARDDRTLEIGLSHPAPYFSAIAGMSVFYPAKLELIERGGADWWQDPALQLGNGPFQVTRLEPGQLAVFEANRRYWGGPPRLDQLEFVYEPESSVALEAYRAGKLDIIILDAELLPEVDGDAALRRELVRTSGAATSFLSFNLTKPPFDDHAVREAFAYAFDRETYCGVVRGGACRPALSWIPPGVPGHVATDLYAFDPEKAREALAASAYGRPEQLPEISFAYWVEDPAIAERTEWVAGQYRDVLGIEVTLQPLAGTPLVDLMSHPATYPRMALTGWVQDYPDPQNWLSVYWMCDAFAQDFGYCSQEFDELARRADRELDPAGRLALYEAAGQVLIDDVPGVFVSHAVFHHLVKPDVSGYVVTAVDAGWPGQTASLLTIAVEPTGD